MQMVDQLEQQVVKEKDRLVAMVEHLKWSEDKIGIAGEQVFVPERHFRENLENSFSQRENRRPPHTYAVLIKMVSV